MSENLKVGLTPESWRTGKFWTKMSMNILLVVIICLSVALCIGSFYFDELFMTFETPLKRVGMQVLAIVGIALYAELVYRFVFVKWAYRAGVGTILALCAFIMFMLLEVIAFVLFLWFSVMQWWTYGLFTIYALPVIFSGLFFLLFFLRRVIEA